MKKFLYSTLLIYCLTLVGVVAEETLNDTNGSKHTRDIRNNLAASIIEQNRGLANPSNLDLLLFGPTTVREINIFGSSIDYKFINSEGETELIEVDMDNYSRTDVRLTKEYRQLIDMFTSFIKTYTNTSTLPTELRINFNSSSVSNANIPITPNCSLDKISFNLQLTYKQNDVVSETKADFDIICFRDSESPRRFEAIFTSPNTITNMNNIRMQENTYPIVVALADIDGQDKFNVRFLSVFEIGERFGQEAEIAISNVLNRLNNADFENLGFDNNEVQILENTWNLLGRLHGVNQEQRAFENITDDNTTRELF